MLIGLVVSMIEGPPLAIVFILVEIFSLGPLENNARSLALVQNPSIVLLLKLQQKLFGSNPFSLNSASSLPHHPPFGVIILEQRTSQQILSFMQERSTLKLMFIMFVILSLLKLFQSALYRPKIK
jgi:hypothetical protein